MEELSLAVLAVGIYAAGNYYEITTGHADLVAAAVSFVAAIGVFAVIFHKLV